MAKRAGIRALRTGVPVMAGIGFNGVVIAVAPGRLPATYGIGLDGPDVTVLLRHRAVLLALVGGLLVVSGFRRELRPTAVAVAVASMSAFVLFARGADTNQEQRQVALLDVLLLLLLGAASVVPDSDCDHRDQ